MIGSLLAEELRREEVEVGQLRARLDQQNLQDQPAHLYSVLHSPLLHPGYSILLVQRYNGTTAGLGHLEVGWNAHAKIPPQAVNL